MGHKPRPNIAVFLGSFSALLVAVVLSRRYGSHFTVTQKILPCIVYEVSVKMDEKISTLLPNFFSDHHSFHQLPKQTECKSNVNVKNRLRLAHLTCALSSMKSNFQNFNHWASAVHNI